MTTPFHEVLFPTTIAMGAIGGPQFKTAVSETLSGYETRIGQWALERGEWDVSQAIRNQQQFDELKRFFRARRGQRYGFRFLDWADRMLPDADQLPWPQFQTNGSVTTFQLFKEYSDDGGSYIRPIVKPVAGSLVLTKDDGTVLTDFTLDATTGIVTLGPTISSTSSVVIHASCEFHVPVRFNIDSLRNTTNDYENYTWGQIPLIELRLYTGAIPASLPVVPA